MCLGCLWYSKSIEKLIFLRVFRNYGHAGHKKNLGCTAPIRHNFIFSNFMKGGYNEKNWNN